MTTPIDRNRVDRFTMEYHHSRTFAKMTHDTDGEWVLYKDFRAALDAAESENKRLQGEIESMRAERIERDRAAIRHSSAISAQGEM